MGEVPEWIKWWAAICAPIVAWFGKDWWRWWTRARAEQLKQDDKIVERRSTRIDNEIERALKLKDELIAELRSQASARNLEVKSLLDEVKLCRQEKEEFARSSGLQAVTIVEFKAEAAHAKAEIADLEKEIAQLRLDLASRNARIAQLEGAQAGVREAVTKLDVPSPPV